MNFDTSDMDLSCFDENQKEAVVNLVQRAADEAVSQRDLTDQIEFKDIPAGGRRLLADRERKVRNMKSVWQNNGMVDGLSEPVTYKELCDADRKWSAKFAQEGRDFGFTSTDEPLLIRRVISEVVREAVEPNIVLTPMLQRINFSHGTQLTFPAVGAITAADIPEGGEYPERSLEMAGQVTATIGKSGVAVKITEETIRYSLYDVMSMHLSAAGKALVRWKEQKVADMITTNAGGANTLFDNTSTSYISTTGRDADGALNGTLTLDDIFKAYSLMINRGFQPDTLLMNPFAWEIFADEAIARAFGFENGVGAWQVALGALGTAQGFAVSAPNDLLNNTQVTEPQQLAQTFTNVPSVFPRPFNIVVTPYMPFDSTSNRTDIVMCQASELGILVVDEEVTTDEWSDPARDIHKVKLRERYGLGTANNGAGTGVLKGISLNRAFDFARKLEPAAVTLPGGQSLTGDHVRTDLV